MPLVALDRAEMERELSRAKLAFGDGNAQKELVMPVLPSATRFSNIKDSDEAIFWTLRGGLDPSYAPEFMPGTNLYDSYFFWQNCNPFIFSLIKREE